MTALAFRTFDQCSNEPPKPWAIKGVLALDEDSSWFGPPGGLKSALLTDVAVHLATGRDWRGHTTKQPLGCVYFALERAALTRRRLAAYAVRDRLRSLPIAVTGEIIDLIDVACVDTIADTVKVAETKFAHPVGLLVFDTYSKGIAAGGGDEDKAQHANIVAANLKLIHERLTHPVHIATIGHTGKDEARGERGSSAKLGHVDLAVQISGETVRTATIVKGNDQPDGPITSFKAEEIAVGNDDDGEPLVVGILSNERVATQMFKTKRTTRQELALNALDRIIRDGGCEPPSGADMPAWLRIVTVDQWRDELFRCGVLSRNAKNPRSAFKKLKDGLAAAEEIAERDGFIWPMQPGTSSMPPIPAARSGAGAILRTPLSISSPVPCPPP